MSKNIIVFSFEVAAFLFLLGIFTLVPMNQITMQGSTIALSIYVYFSAKHKGITKQQLGLQLPSKEMVVKWVILTLVMSLSIVILKMMFPDGLFNGVSKNRQAFYLLIPFYVLLGTFFQELIFRGYLFARTSKLFSMSISILINILLFSIFHLPYFIQLRSNLIYLSMAAGVFWSFMYAKYPNLYLSWASHAIVGSLNLLLLQRF